MRGSPSRVVVVGGRGGSAVSLLELSDTLRGDRGLPQAGRWEFGHGVRKTSHREIKGSGKKKGDPKIFAVLGCLTVSPPEGVRHRLENMRGQRLKTTAGSSAKLQEANTSMLTHPALLTHMKQPAHRRRSSAWPQAAQRIPKGRRKQNKNESYGSPRHF